VPRIPFNQPQLVGREHAYIDEAIASGKLSGNGLFSRRCADWFEREVGARRALITPSCTAALEMSAILAEVGPDDEVIMPSFTFVSCANAFALRGATPVFVDVVPDTLNIDPDAVAAAITERTRAIVAVHYGGVACDMARLGEIASRHDLILVEDAAHALPAAVDGRPLGSIGQLATFSFHETKNVHCGEGGALLVNDPALVERAEIVQEKGTNRARFFRGEISKYTWQDIGSSYLLSEVAAAFLWAQLEHLEDVTRRRLTIWRRYHDAFATLEEEGALRRPMVPAGCEHSAHLYYLLLPTQERRDELITRLAARDVQAVFHYVPLHESPAGRRFGRAAGALDATSDLSGRLVRLPLWAGLGPEDIERVIAAVAGSVPPGASARPSVTRWPAGHAAG
jgi:dTDP-4-amino-4,6-dideoxygalactose transaminase